MNARAVARDIVRLRVLLIAGMIAELADDPEGRALAGAEFESRAGQLPVAVAARGGLTRRVYEPAMRKVRREGILAQGGSHLTI